MKPEFENDPLHEAIFHKQKWDSIREIRDGTIWFGTRITSTCSKGCDIEVKTCFSIGIPIPDNIESSGLLLQAIANRGAL